MKIKLMKFDHPGGNSLLAKDINVFKSVHPGEKYEKLLKYFKLDLYSESKTTKYIFDSDFAKDLKKLNFGKSHKAPIMWWVRFGVLNVLLVYFENDFIYKATLMNSVVLGIVYAGLGLCIGHDGSHGAVGNKYINEFCTYYMDFIGNTNYAWHKQHIKQHHPYTNEYIYDPDVTAGEPFVVYDEKSKNKKKIVNSFGILMLGFLIVYDVRKLTPEKTTPLRNIIVSCVLKMYLFYKILHPYRFFYGQLMVAIAGSILGVLFSVSHNTYESERNKLETSNDWYKNQIESSTTYGNYIYGFLTGGLNYQIEHHIFPHMNSMYYSTISNDVKTVCKKHKVKYNYYKNFNEIFNSFLKLLFA
jgi:fatty acid desaturase